MFQRQGLAVPLVDVALAEVDRQLLNANANTKLKIEVQRPHIRTHCATHSDVLARNDIDQAQGAQGLDGDAAG